MGRGRRGRSLSCALSFPLFKFFMSSCSSPWSYGGKADVDRDSWNLREWESRWFPSLASEIGIAFFPSNWIFFFFFFSSSYLVRLLLFTLTTVISQYTPLHRKLIHHIQYLFICRLLFFKQYVSCWYFESSTQIQRSKEWQDRSLTEKKKRKKEQVLQ